MFAGDYRTIRAARNSRIVSEREKNREGAARLSAAAENKARLRNATRRARSPTTFLYGKDGSEIATTRIWVSMHCGATRLTQSAAASMWRGGGFYAHENRHFIRPASL